MYKIKTVTAIFFKNISHSLFSLTINALYFKLLSWKEKIMMNYYDPFDCEICCEEVYVEEFDWSDLEDED